MKPQVDNSYVLLWDFADLIHPMLKLETPHEIFCFRFNPSMPGVSVPHRLESTGPAESTRVRFGRGDVIPPILALP